MPRHRRKFVDAVSAVILLAIVIVDAAAWKGVFDSARASGSAARIVPLSSAGASGPVLVILSSGTVILTGGGKDGTIVDAVQKALPPGSAQYIDIAIIPSPDPSGYGGYQYLFAHYHVGAVLYNGRRDDTHPADWDALMGGMTARKIPIVTVGAGDGIRYGRTTIRVVAPDSDFVRSPDLRETGLALGFLAPSGSEGILLYNKEE